MQRERVAIVGATGYAGAELTAILAHHTGAEISAVFSGTQGETRAFSSLHPSLRRTAGPDVVPFTREALGEADASTVFLATPNEFSAEVAAGIVAGGARVIDLSGAFRLRRAADYRQWYGFDHPHPELLEESVYGLTEWCNGELKKARLIANPGCYPTSALLALKPLTRFLDRHQPIICNSLSGVSGAGKKSDVGYSFSELAGNCRAYSVGGHRHQPEIRGQLDVATYTPLVFIPHLLPTVRGILSTIHVGFLRQHGPEEIVAAFEAAYADSPFVTVLPPGELPELKNVVGTPRCEIGFALVDAGRRAVVVSVIDNLLKGAAAQAVQNFNRAAGFAETEGLQ
jgi:N-acetyl-gamma-glutamyl-phosphate reductase